MWSKTVGVFLVRTMLSSILVQQWWTQTVQRHRPRKAETTESFLTSCHICWLKGKFSSSEEAYGYPWCLCIKGLGDVLLRAHFLWQAEKNIQMRADGWRDCSIDFFYGIGSGCFPLFLNFKIKIWLFLELKKIPQSTIQSRAVYFIYQLKCKSSMICIYNLL